MNILSLVQNNPYRVLGVCANASKKEITANQGKMKAFLKVGKAVAFPIDLPRLLPDVCRNEHSVADANAKLTLPKDQIKYAQFWFVNSSPFDQIAINHLVNGDIDEAIGIWGKKVNASSLHNLVVCYLIKQDWQNVFASADKLYGSYADSFAQLILGEDTTFDSSSLANDFLNILTTEVDAKILMPFVGEAEKQMLSAGIVKPLVDELQDAVSTAKATRGNGSTARYNAGNKLMKVAKNKLAELKSVLPAGDIQYQMIADKVATEILQCGIDYYNDSNAADAALKAMTLQNYALSIAVGKMVKDRCQENVNILKGIIAALPPKEVMEESRLINEARKKFNAAPTGISYAETLLNETKPLLDKIKSKLGETNAFYLKISTNIVRLALNDIIEEVNEAQKAQTIKLDSGFEFDLPMDENQKRALKATLRYAWKVTKIMDGFDMESSYKSAHYTPNRNTLTEICDQIGINTGNGLINPYTAFKPVQSRPAPKPTPRQTYTTTTSSGSDDNSGCFWVIAITIILFFFYFIIKCNN